MKKISPQSKKRSSNSHLYVVALTILTILAIVGGIFYSRTQSSQKNQSVLPSENMSVKDIYSAIDQMYAENIPWDTLNQREAYQFFPKQINGFTLFMDEVGEAYSDNYIPITSLTLTDDGKEVPIASAYDSYYEVPDVLKSKLHMKREDSAFTLELAVYEFDRVLTGDEREIIQDESFMKCNHDTSETKRDTFVNDRLVIHYCNLNLSQSEIENAKDSLLFDQVYGVYLVDRNIFIQMSMKGAYVSDSSIYFKKYLSTLFSSNPDQFMTQDAIRTVEDARRFRERVNEFLNK